MPAPPSAPTASAAPSARVVVERPPPGLLRGQSAGPAWLLALIGALALLVTVAFYTRVLRRRRNS